jgi:hypothetical protein
MRRLYTSLGLIVFTVASLFAADDFWQKKDYQQWTSKECQQLLSKSPWSRSADIVDVVIQTIGQNDAPPPPRTGANMNTSQTTITPDETSASRASNNRINYVVQFRSAPPIRKAVVRSALINVNVDAQPPEKKKAYQDQAEQFVSAQFPDIVLVHVTYSSNVARYDRELANFWQHQTVDTIRNSFFLIGAHGRVAPLAFEAKPGAEREFEVTFPRTQNGEPVVGPSDKQLAVEFIHPTVAGKSESRMLIQFKVQDMVNDGKVIY